MRGEKRATKIIMCSLNRHCLSHCYVSKDWLRVFFHCVAVVTVHRVTAVCSVCDHNVLDFPDVSSVYHLLEQNSHLVPGVPSVSSAVLTESSYQTGDQLAQW